MPANTQILHALRDIHLPKAISFWPPAPGWFVLVILGIAVFVSLAYYLQRRWQRSKANKAALLQLAVLQQQRQEMPATEVAANIAILLRRVALSHYLRTDIAALQGDAWLHFLDKTGKTNTFIQHKHLLLKIPYKKHTKNDVTILFTLAKRWIKYHV